MPELPEVEVFRRYLDDHVRGRRVVAVHASDSFVRRSISERQLRSGLSTRVLEDTRRYGKWVFVEAVREPVAPVRGASSSRWLALHFGMTGAPVVLDAGAALPRFPRFVADFADGGHLVLDDARRLGSVGLTDASETWVSEHHLGPDALDAPREDVADALRRRHGRVKPLLLDQTAIAGVGNVYADEILYHARLHPLRRAGDLDDATILRLAETIHDVMAVAVDLGAMFHLMPERLARPRSDRGGVVSAVPRHRREDHARGPLDVLLSLVPAFVTGSFSVSPRGRGDAPRPRRTACRRPDLGVDP